MQTDYLSKKTASNDSYSAILTNIVTGLSPTKDLNKALERQLLFCSSTCNEKSLNLERKFDHSSPYNRSIVQMNKEALSKASYISSCTAAVNPSGADSVIDSMFSLLSVPIKEEESQPKAKELSFDQQDDVQPEVSLPAAMDENGRLSVVFEEGLPVCVPLKKREPPAPQAPANPSPPLLHAADPNTDTGSDGVEMGTEEFPAVFHPPMPSCRRPARFTPRKPSTTSSSSSSSISSTNMKPQEIGKEKGKEEPFQEDEGNKKKVTFASILESVKGRSSDAPRPQRRPLLQQVDAQSQWDRSWSLPSPPPPPITPLHREEGKKAPTSSSQSEVEPPKGKESGSKGQGKKEEGRRVIDTGAVVERRPAAPMSAAAILLKQEPQPEEAAEELAEVRTPSKCSSSFSNALAGSSISGGGGGEEHRGICAAPRRIGDASGSHGDRDQSGAAHAGPRTVLSPRSLRTRLERGSWRREG